MATKTELPPIDEEIARPRPRLNLRNLKPRDILPDETIEANSRTMGVSWGASTRLSQQEEQTTLTSVRLDLPEYVDRQLKLKVATAGGTKAYYILKALAGDGFQIRGEDLRLDRRKRGKQKI
jgi:hypothetical protein